MTEKRFRITDNGIEDTLLKEQYIKIKESDEVLDSISFTHLIYLVELLNELHEEVMDLRRENTKFKLTVSEIIEDMQKYVDDNQLVYINQSYVDWIKKEVDTTLYPQKKELEE